MLSTFNIAQSFGAFDGSRRGYSGAVVHSVRGTKLTGAVTE